MKPHSIQHGELTNPHPRNYVRILRMAILNAAFIIASLLLIALVGEGYLRLANPFINRSVPYHFVDGVGLIRKPNAELRFAYWHDDNFVVSRTNSLGFLDREPVSAERAAAGCHMAFIGDSFVEAREVPIADKFHVRLEEMAARELPHLDITTQAYGISNTGQINQIPFYDEYARHLKPKVVVLVLYANDFANNSPALYSLGNGLDPDRMPFMSAQRDETGALKLRAPDPEFERFTFPRQSKRPYADLYFRLTQVSYFAKWLDTKNLIRVVDWPSPTDEYANMIAERPCCAWILDVFWPPGSLKWTDRGHPFGEEHMSPYYKDALEYTTFGIDQFKQRADRDGARLIILAATEDVGTPGNPGFDRLSAIAEARGIPVISDYEYIVRQRHDADDGRWLNLHWNAVGHQWVAETVMEWLKENQDVCG